MLQFGVFLMVSILLSGVMSHELEHELDELDLDHMNGVPSASKNLQLGPQIVKFPCLPIVWAEPMPAEQLAKIDLFQKGWFQQKAFPRREIAADERLWLLNMTVMPLRKNYYSKPAQYDSTRQKRHAPTGGDPDCYEIPSPIRTRKEYRQLTSAERSSYHNALNAMKSDFPFASDPTLSAYDFLVTLHRYSMAPAAHGGAAFLPWHREYLFVFENALFEYGFSGPGLPYWDSTLDQTLPDPSDSAIWTASYMGNNDGDVTSGPAAYWNVIPDCNFISSNLNRNTATGSSGKFDLYSDTDLNYVFGKNCFKDISCQEDCTFEFKHGSVHVWIGGHMSSTTCAPSDPIFFMHHGFIDCVWEEFREKHQETDPETEYPSNIAHGDNIGWGSGLPHEWDSPMEPFENLINAHGLSNHYTNYYYQCRRRPKFCFSNFQCGSSILWCDTSACRCRAKVRQGGDCTGLPNKACAGPCPFGEFPRCNSSTDKCDCQAFIIKADTIKLPGLSEGSDEWRI